LLLSGFPGGEEDVLDLGAALTQYGFNTLTFNYRGTYESEGHYLGFQDTQQDIQAAFAFLRDDETVRTYEIDVDRLILGGWSYGGGMGLIYAANNPDVKHVFSIAGTDHGEFAREYWRNESFSTMIDTSFTSLSYPDGPVRFSGKSTIREELRQQLSENAAPYDLVDQAGRLIDRDVLLIGAWDDKQVVLERHILPLYRSLKDLGSTRVTITAFQDGHEFESSRLALAQTIDHWIKGLPG
jgi:pimeloyl-ACP methyl ester carboxylesterase